MLIHDVLILFLSHAESNAQTPFISKHNNCIGWKLPKSENHAEIRPLSKRDSSGLQSHIFLNWQIKLSKLKGRLSTNLTFFSAKSTHSLSFLTLFVKNFETFTKTQVGQIVSQTGPFSYPLNTSTSCYPVSHVTLIVLSPWANQCYSNYSSYSNYLMCQT